MYYGEISANFFYLSELDFNVTFPWSIFSPETEKHTHEKEPVKVPYM